MKKLSKSVAWVVVVLLCAVNAATIGGVDYIFGFFGVLVGIWVISYILLLPLFLVRKSSWIGEWLPYVCLITSSVSLIGNFVGN